MKRVHVFLLSFILVMLWSLSAMAASMDVKDDTELLAAIQDATVNEVVLTNNIVTSGGYVIERDIIIRSQEGQQFSITHDDNNTNHNGLFDVTGNMEIRDLTVSGFTKEQGDGGAVRVSGSVTILNSRFENNIASAARGGAVSAQGAAATIEDSSFVGNQALGGGGVYANMSHVTIKNSHFDQNIAMFLESESASGSGGAVQADNAIESLAIEDCTFTQNEAGHWGGAVALSGNKDNVMLDISGSSFTQNKAADVGGAVQGKNITISNCTFTENEALGTEKSYGGAVFGSETVTIADSTFHNNKASESAGAVQGAKSGSITVMNCVFEGNAVQTMGGAISSYQGPITVADCDFYGNEAGGNASSVCSEDSGEILMQGTSYFDANVTGGEEIEHGLWTGDDEKLMYAEGAEALSGRREQTEEMTVSDIMGTIKVINDGINVRTNPGTGDNAIVVGKAHIGEMFDVVAQDDETGWYQFIWKDGQKVWISSKTVEFTPAGE